MLDRALGKWREFISTEKGFYISSFEIPEYFCIILLVLVFLIPYCEGRLVTPLSNDELLGESLFSVTRGL